MIAPASPAEEPDIRSSPLMTVAQVAEYLAISTRQVWRLTSSGRIPEPLRIGGLVRWRRNDIDNWIEAGCPED